MMRRLASVLLVACSKPTAVTVVEERVEAPAPVPSAASVEAGSDAGDSVVDLDAIQPAARRIELPAVACKGGGQMGPHAIELPKRRTAPLTIALAALASPEKVLALYYGDSGVVLGPAGFHCDSASGSGGAATWVLPPGVTSHEKMKGAAIVHHQHVGGTSGRFSVIEVGAPLFPGMAAMAREVAAGWPDMPRARPYKPIAGETTRSGTTLVRFADDPTIAGLGTKEGDFVPSSAPMVGSLRAIANKDVAGSGAFDLETITIRLEGAHVALIPAVQADFEDRSLHPSGS